MPVIEVESLNYPGIDVFHNLTETQLLSYKNSENGLFIAESPKVITTAINAGYVPLSLLCERKHIEGDAASIIKRYPDIPVFTGNREILADLTGYKLTRGVLCAMKRKPLPSLQDICKRAKNVAVIDNVCDTTNIGSIFRSAAALGIDAILLTPGTCDPLNRRAVRVSMGSVFLIPWTWIDSPLNELKTIGFTTIALALREDSVNINDPLIKKSERIALILGTEGDGLSRKVIEGADIVARIPMFHGVDSLNVGAAAAVAFWEISQKR